jgi:voltage-gated potassium channel
MLESIAPIRAAHGTELRAAEWVFTLLFTVEYVLRLACVRRPLAYASSFFGVVDLLAVLPTYVSLVLPGTQALVVVRAVRLLRIFRIFKIARYVHELAALVRAVRATRAKIAVFLFAILSATLVLGTAMYVVEGEASGFTSIPRAVYWAIVTVTTVGYGDLAPRSPLGQALAALAMVLGYSLIIIPTGIFSAELIQVARAGPTTRACPACSREGHDADAEHCKYCGEKL